MKMKENIKVEEIREIIINIINNRSPNTVKELINIIECEYKLEKKEILEQIIELENKNIITLKKMKIEKPENIKNFFFSPKSYWFWLNGVIIIFTIIGVYFIHPNNYPINYLRFFLGSISILILPGYNLIKTLFPRKEISYIERITLSIGCSIVIIPLIGLLLNYTNFGLRLTPIIISLSTLTIFLSITAVYRQYNIINQDQVINMY